MDDRREGGFGLTTSALVRLHPQMLVSMAVGVSVWAWLARISPGADHVVLGWDAGVVTYLAISWYFMLTSSVERLKKRADNIDLPDGPVLLFSIIAAAASFFVIYLLLQGVHQGGGNLATTRPLEAAATILLSWIFVHTLFTVHYAHNFYANEGPARGLKFPEDCPEPIYWDFLYFSFTIGVAAQTADVAVTSMPTRRLVLAHSILAFLFNTTIVALAVNVGANLI